MAIVQEREMGFEPTTTTLATWRSTPELLPRGRQRRPEDSTQTTSLPASRFAKAKPSIGPRERISSRLRRIWAVAAMRLVKTICVPRRVGIVLDFPLQSRLLPITRISLGLSNHGF